MSDQGVSQPKARRVWMDFNRISKTRKPHRCAITGKIIPVGSSCWQYIGEWEGEFQNWYCTNESKQFWDDNPSLVMDVDGDCSAVGEIMQERGLIA